MSAVVKPGLLSIRSVSLKLVWHLPVPPSPAQHRHHSAPLPESCMMWTLHRYGRDGCGHSTGMGGEGGADGCGHSTGMGGGGGGGGDGCGHSTGMGGMDVDTPQVWEGEGEGMDVDTPQVWEGWMWTLHRYGREGCGHGREACGHGKDGCGHSTGMAWMYHSFEDCCYSMLIHLCWGHAMVH